MRMKEKTIIIHSQVSYGYVGSNTTSFILKAAGYDAITIPTVLYSNHLGHRTVGGQPISDNLLENILEGILKLNILHEVSTIITGFMGSVKQTEITANFIKIAQQKNPNIKHLCDPVMGDTDKGLYVHQSIPEAITKNLVPLANLLTPNKFELDLILKQNLTNIEESRPLLNTTFNLSEQKIVVTGCMFASTATDEIDNYILENNHCTSISGKKIALHPAGTGDLFTAHLQLSILKGLNLPQAVSNASKALTTSLKNMDLQKRTEFDLQDLLFSLQVIKNC